MIKNNKQAYIFLFALGLIMFILHLNLIYVDIMEARNMVSAREMVDGGNWMLPTLNGEPRFEKPPLPTWITAIMGSIFGFENLFWLRLPAGLSALIMLFYTYALVREITESRHMGFWTGLVLSTAFLIVFVSRKGMWDVYAFSFGMAAIFHFYQGWKRYFFDYKNYLIAGLFFGCSVLCKGPTAIYALFIPFLVVLFIQKYSLWFNIKKAFWPLVLVGVITIIITSIWVGYLALYEWNELMQALQKETEARVNRDTDSFTRYLSFPVQMGVWTPLALIGLLSPFFIKDKELKKQLVFFILWTLISVFLISLMPSKKERYLFPVMIPLAMLVGSFIASRYQEKPDKLMRWVYGLIGFILIVASGLVIYFMWAESAILSLILGSMWFISGSMMFIMYAIQGKNFRLAHFAPILAMMAFSITGFPLIEKFLNKNENYRPIQYFQNKENLPVYGLSLYSPEMWFYYGKKMPVIQLDEVEKKSKDGAFYLFIADKERPETWKAIQLSKKVAYQEIAVYDNNPEPPNSNNYKQRKRLKLIKIFHQK